MTYTVFIQALPWLSVMGAIVLTLALILTLIISECRGLYRTLIQREQELAATNKLLEFYKSQEEYE